MKKIFIIGIVASGKTTLAKRMSVRLGIPWYELDTIVHYETTEGRIKRTAQQQVEVILEIDREGQWIFEGTDRASYRCLYDMADTIIVLDPPLRKRKTRILTRYIKQKVGIEKCHYHPNLQMLKKMFAWTNEFEKNRADFEANIKKYEHKVVTVCTKKQMNDLFVTLRLTQE